MPIPVYVMCSASGAVDQRTNLVSLFNIIEAIQVYAEGAPDEEIRSQPGRGNTLFVMAVWMREESDPPGAKYDGEVVLLAPNGDVLVAAGAGAFEFPPDDLFYRFQVPNFPLVGFPSLGVSRVEARIRLTGTNEWLAPQSFPFIVRESKKETKSKDAPTPNKTP